MPGDALARFAAELRGSGLNLVGCVPTAAARDTVFPGRTCPAPAGGTVIVCGSGGRAHWDALTPEELAREHPIFHAGQAAVGAALALLDRTARLAGPEDIAPFDLRALARRAGWGVVSPYLQLLIHPEYGPWVSIRSLVFTSLALPATGPVEGFDPCGPCPRPCLDACPAGAYSRDHDWDFELCAAHRLRERDVPQHCADQCHSRLACPIGSQHAYGPDEHRHRHRASLDDIRAWYRTRE